MNQVYVVSNMFPSQNDLAYGVFVKEQVDSLEKCGISIKLNVIKKENSKIKKLVRYCLLWLKAIFEIFLGKSKVIHVHYVYPTGIFIPIKRIFTSKKIVVTVHGSDVVVKSEVKRFFLKKIFRSCDHIVVVGSGLKKEIKTDYDIESDKISIIPCGYSPELFYKSEKNRNSDKINILFLSRLYKEKGVNTLSEIVEKMKDDNKFHFWIVGDGPEKNNLLTTLEKHENVTFGECGNKQDVAAWFQSADIFLFPTQREGFGLVVLEAMACGVPVITSDVCGVVDLVEHRRNGYLAKVDDANSFVKSIYEMVETSDMKMMGHNAIKTAGSFTNTNQATKIAELYKCLGLKL